MYEDEQDRQELLMSWRSVGASVAVHALLFVVVWLAGCALMREPEVVIPIDMTIVPPWAEQVNDPEPDPLPPPPPPPKAARVKPPPKAEEAPKLADTKQDAVIKEKPKPKPKKREVKKGDFLKNAKLVKKQPPKTPPDFRKNAKLVKAPKMRETGKATAADKPMSQEEFKKYMMQGYKIGARNQLAANEESRCVSLVAAALKRNWRDDFHWTESLVSVYLEITFGAGGRLKSYRIVRSSGDAQVDRSVLAAVRATGSVAGLSPDFVRKYSSTPFVLEMKPVRQ